MRVQTGYQLSDCVRELAKSLEVQQRQNWSLHPFDKYVLNPKHWTWAYSDNSLDKFPAFLDSEREREREREKDNKQVNISD